MQLEARGDATFENLVQATDTLLYYAAQRKELSGLSSSLQAEIPQLYFDVDRDKVKLSGVPMADEDLHRIGLRQRLQHVQPYLPRVHTG